MGDPVSIPGPGKIPWRKEWQPTPVFLPGEFHRQRSLASYSPWNLKELDTTEGLTLSLSLDSTALRNPRMFITGCIYCVSQVALVVKNQPPNAGDIRDLGSLCSYCPIY